MFSEVQRFQYNPLPHFLKARLWLCFHEAGNFRGFSQMSTSQKKTSTLRKSLKNLGFLKKSRKVATFKRNQRFPCSSRILRKRALLDLIKNKKDFHPNQVKIISFSFLQYIVCIAVVSFSFFLLNGLSAQQKGADKETLSLEISAVKFDCRDVS